jgi:3-oxoacyl-ACP reductase-like protein
MASSFCDACVFPNHSGGLYTTSEIGSTRKDSRTNKVAVITGASEGIGRDIAIGLAEAGADIIIQRSAKKLGTIQIPAF